MTAEKLLNRLPVEIIQQLKDCEQSPKWHKEGSVYNHLLLVVQAALDNNDNLGAVAGCLHDLGKLKTTTKVDGKISSIGHELASVNMMMDYIHLYEDLVPVGYWHVVKTIVYHHMKAHLYKDGVIKKKSKLEEFESNPFFKEIMVFESYDAKGALKG